MSKFRAALVALSLVFGAAVVSGIADEVTDPPVAEAYGWYYRGYGCVGSICGHVHANSRYTPTFGHVHFRYAWYNMCQGVKIAQDWGSIVIIQGYGSPYFC